MTSSPVTCGRACRSGCSTPAKSSALSTRRASARRWRRSGEHGVESVAVGLLWSIVNPQHEQRVAELIQEELPDVYVALSSQILPAMREYPRTCATVLSAYVGPVLGKYLSELAGYLRDNGYRYDLLIMQITGGSAS